MANAGPPASARDTRRAVTASVRAVAGWLGDTPAVARSSYIDPRLISRYEADGGLATIPVLPPELPASADAPRGNRPPCLGVSLFAIVLLGLNETKGTALRGVD